MLVTDADDCEELVIDSVIGFNGSVPGGLQYTPCGLYIFYPLGSTIVLRRINSRKNIFLHAHSDIITCVAVSRDGRYLATGQQTQETAKANAIIWDFDQAKRMCMEGKSSAECCVMHRLSQHFGKVQSVDFSFDGLFLVSTGGQDDNDLVVWNVDRGIGICGSSAANDSVKCVKWLNKRNDRFITCGNYHFRVWQVDVSSPKLNAVDASMGPIQRIMQCVSITNDDLFAFVGSKTGEVIKFSIDREEIDSTDTGQIRPCLKDYSKDRFSQGVKSVFCFQNPINGHTDIFVGAGDGIVHILNSALKPRNKIEKMQLTGAVTSLSFSRHHNAFCAGTDLSQRYLINLKSLTPELKETCHFGEIFDIKFPKNCSELFVTASINDIRVWNATRHQELVRIQVPNLSCHAIQLTPSGSTLVSAWSDGKIRAFSPETGKLIFVIPDAHVDGVSSLELCNESDKQSDWRLISGGRDGRVRVWKISATCQSMIHSMKEHKGTVTAIRCSKDGNEAISSANGSCIVWDLRKGIRINALYDSTVFNDITAHPDESQYIACCSNFKISYWDTFDGSVIRYIDGGSAEMTCLDVQPDGEYFVTGSADKLVKLWHYDDGMTVAVGRGHSGTVNKIAISPNKKRIISVGGEGAIFIWKLP